MSPANPPPLQSGPALRGQGDAAVTSPADAGVVRDDAGSNRPDAGPVQGEAGFVDAGAPTDAGGGSTFDAAAFGDASGLAPFDDAATTPSTRQACPCARRRRRDGVRAVTRLDRLPGATLNPTVVPAGAVAQLNPLLSAQHPLTLADLRADGGMLLQVSGTLANGISQQYFPVRLPGDARPAHDRDDGLVAVALGLSAPEAPSTGWVHLVDASASDVWIPLTAVSTTQPRATRSASRSSSGQSNAVIPSSGGSVGLASPTGARRSRSCWRHDPASINPAGWAVRVLFPSAAIAQVTFK